MANAERLQGTLDYIKAHPEKHHQCTWISFEGGPPGQADLSDPDLDPVHGCGTVACYAGWASLLYGPEERWRPVRLGSEFFDHPARGQIHTRHLAPVLLDLDADEADYLFSATRTLDELETAIGEIIDGTFVARDEDYDYGEGDDDA